MGLLERFKPVNNRVLVEKLETASMSAGGLFIPDTGRDLPQQGKVVAVSEPFPFALAVGDTVMFGKYAGLELKLEHKEYLMLEDIEVLGVLSADDSK